MPAEILASSGAGSIRTWAMSNARQGTTVLAACAGAVWTIVVAAGAGDPLRRPKQFADLGGRRVVDWSLDAAAGRRPTASSWCVPPEPTPRASRRRRGGRRRDPGRVGARRAGRRARPTPRSSCVHDAARPFAAPSCSPPSSPPCGPAPTAPCPASPWPTPSSRSTPTAWWSPRPTRATLGGRADAAGVPRRRPARGPRRRRRGHRRRRPGRGAGGRVVIVRRRARPTARSPCPTTSRGPRQRVVGERR